MTCFLKDLLKSVSLLAMAGMLFYPGQARSCWDAFNTEVLTDPASSAGDVNSATAEQQAQQILKQLNDQIKEWIADKGAAGANTTANATESITKTAQEQLKALIDRDDVFTKVGEQSVTAAAKKYEEDLLKARSSDQDKKNDPEARRENMAGVETAMAWGAASYNQDRVIKNADKELGALFTKVFENPQNEADQWAANTAVVLTIAKEMIALSQIAAYELTYEVGEIARSDIKDQRKFDAKDYKELSE